MEHYGNGPSTGLDPSAAGQISTGLVPACLLVSQTNRDVLRPLAERVASLPASSYM